MRQHFYMWGSVVGVTDLRDLINGKASRPSIVLEQDLGPTVRQSALRRAPTEERESREMRQLVGSEVAFIERELCQIALRKLASRMVRSYAST